MGERRGRVILTMLVLAAGLSVGGPAAAQPAMPGEAGAIPVVRTFGYVVPDSGVAVAGVVHQVTRVPHGTLVVWSIGPRDRDVAVSRLVRMGGDFNDEVSSVGPYLAKVADPSSKTVLKPLVLDKKCLCSDFLSRSGEVKAGRLVVLYAVFPQVASTTRVVDLDLGGFGSFVSGVPVTSSAGLGPAGSQGVPDLGVGWPGYPADEQVAAAVAADKPAAVWDMTVRTGRADNSARVAEGTQTTVDLAADVLFAFDAAELTGAATSGLTLAAERIKAAKASSVTVTGYTDSTGPDAYNLTLSQRRAEAVRGALAGLVPGVQITATGKGEADPVASNDNAEGQALNRRVSIVFEGGR